MHIFEGSLVVLCQQGTWLFHMEIKRKGWFREPLVVVFGQLSKKILYQESVSSELLCLSGDNFSCVLVEMKEGF